MAYPTHLEQFGKQIKTMRDYRGLTQSELAEQAGIRQATISDIEAGRTNFEINTLIKICSALNFIFDYSFTPHKYFVIKKPLLYSHYNSTKAIKKQYEKTNSKSNISKI